MGLGFFRRRPAEAPARLKSLLLAAGFDPSKLDGIHSAQRILELLPLTSPPPPKVRGRGSRRPVWQWRALAHRSGPLPGSMTVLTGPGCGFLSAGDRDLFWQVYQAPIYERLIGFDVRTAAWECDAHDGLHIDGDEAVFEIVDGELVLTSLSQRFLRARTGFAAEWSRGDCPCGAAAPRIRLVGEYNQHQNADAGVRVAVAGRGLVSAWAERACIL